MDSSKHISHNRFIGRTVVTPSDDSSGETAKVEPSAIDWTAMRSLMAAQTATTRALEQYCLSITHPGAETDTDEFIQRAIDRHQEIVEDLSLAADVCENRAEASTELDD